LTEDVTREALVERMWAEGDLSYILHSGQEDLRRAFYANKSRLFVMLCSRRYGKSFLGCVLAIEAALRKPGAQVPIAAPTAKMVKTIIEPHFRTILADCPEHMRPVMHKQDMVWVWPNGSENHVIGCDNGGHERARGRSTDLAIVEEAGFIDDLDYIISDILMPQTITTDGRIVVITSPGLSPAHPIYGICAEAESRGALSRRTIFDAPHVTDAQREEYCAEAGGPESTTWKREYLAEFVVDKDSAVIPEFLQAEEKIVVETEKPRHFVWSGSMDVGYSDLTVALGGYYDFRAAKLRVEWEVVAQHATSAEIMERLKAEASLRFGDQKPASLVVDAPQILVADLNSIHGMGWTVAKKDDKMAAINALRLAIQNGQVTIHPRCKTLISHLKYAIWNKARTSFERSGAYGHFDAVDAMVYLWRHADRVTNPFPPLEGMPQSTHWIRRQKLPGNAIRDAFNRAPLRGNLGN
jgi:hypothetical protein